MTQKILSVSGSILIGIPYVIFGLAHFIKPAMFQKIQPDWMHGSVIYTYLVGALMLLCGLSVATGKLGKISSLTLAVLVTLLMFGIHVPRMFSDNPEIMAQGIDGTFKDVGLIGGFLVYAAYAKPIGKKIKNGEK